MTGDWRARVVDAAPALALTVIGAGALATVVLVGPPEYGCGDFTPPGQDAAVHRFRVLAFSALAVAAAASVIVLVYAFRAQAGWSRHKRAWKALSIFVGLLALALLVPITRPFLAFTALIAAEVWVLPAVVLAGVSLVAIGPIDPSSRPRFTLAVASLVLALLLLLGVWAAYDDGGPVIC